MGTVRVPTLNTVLYLPFGITVARALLRYVGVLYVDVPPFAMMKIHIFHRPVLNTHVVDYLLETF